MDYRKLYYRYSVMNIEITNVLNVYGGTGTLQR